MQPDQVVTTVGKDLFSWMATEFERRTTLMDLPDGVLDRLATVDITLRNYAADPNTLTAIALITFAYRMANRTQKAWLGAKDILLLKVLAKGERQRREKSAPPVSSFWELPLVELITGEVGERIRATRTMNTSKTHGL